MNLLNLGNRNRSPGDQKGVYFTPCTFSSEIVSAGSPIEVAWVWSILHARLECHLEVGVRYMVSLYQPSWAIKCSNDCDKCTFLCWACRTCEIVRLLRILRCTPPFFLIPCDNSVSAEVLTPPAVFMLYLVTLVSFRIIFGESHLLRSVWGVGVPTRCRLGRARGTLVEGWHVEQVDCMTKSRMSVTQI